MCTTVRRRRARRSSSARRFALCIVPMQTIQLLGGRRGAAAFLRCARRAPRAGRRARGRDRRRCSSCSRSSTARPRRCPTSASIDGVVYSSQPTAVRADGERIRARAPARDRSPPSGERRPSDDDDPARPADRRGARGRGARRAGCARPAARRSPPTDDYVGSDGGDARVPDAPLRVCALYPDLMNIYADRGNLLLLERRCALARDRLRADRAAASASGSTPTRADLFYIGGGQDRDQRLCALDLAEVKRDALHAAAERGARDPRRLRRLPAARPLLPARRRDAARRRAGRPARPCARTARA